MRWPGPGGKPRPAFFALLRRSVRDCHLRRLSKITPYEGSSRYALIVENNGCGESTKPTHLGLNPDYLSKPTKLDRPWNQLQGRHLNDDNNRSSSCKW